MDRKLVEKPNELESPVSVVTLKPHTRGLSHSAIFFFFPNLTPGSQAPSAATGTILNELSSQMSEPRLVFREQGVGNIIRHSFKHSYFRVPTQGVNGPKLLFFLKSKALRGS